MHKRKVGVRLEKALVVTLLESGEKYLGRVASSAFLKVESLARHNAWVAQRAVVHAVFERVVPP